MFTLRKITVRMPLSRLGMLSSVSPLGLWERKVGPIKFSCPPDPAITTVPTTFAQQVRLCAHRYAAAGSPPHCLSSGF